MKTPLFLFISTILFAMPHYSTAVKEKKIYPMGKKIYETQCPAFDPSSFDSYESLQAALKNESFSKTLTEKHLEALGLYLWEVKRENKTTNIHDKLHVSKDEKCPVCGMFLYKYPTWISKITYSDKSYYFDGIKDMFKYYFEHKEHIKEMLVQDYYTQKIFDASKAFFVIGSDVYGPMGNEFIAFDTLVSAKKFLLDHKGKKIILFEDVDEEMVYSLDD